MSGFRSVLGLCALLALAVAVGTASGGNSANAKLCQKGGWASSGLQTGTGESISFGNQDACVSYGARTGPLFSPTLTTTNARGRGPGRLLDSDRVCTLPAPA